jgi:multiple sugar transport system ATP-binding protein
MIAGLEEISGGEIAIEGKRVNETPAKQRNIAMVFQNYALYPHMSVAENMGFALSLARVPKAEQDRRVREAAEILDLVPYLDRKPRALSGGQRQRVAMGRAIVRNPAVFLFDEPLSNLDAKLRVQMRSEIKALHARLGATMVYVTHDQVEAMTMADRIVVMRAGRIEQVGTPEALYDAPANTFVAQFIGSPSMNLIEANVVGDRLVLPDGQDIGLAPPQHFAGQKIVIGKRPEDITVSETTGPTFTSVSTSLTGPETHLTALAGKVVVDVMVRGRLPTGVTSTRLDFTQGLTHFFDAETGMRIR